ncbi:MAG: methyltransferase domain-containing protein [Pseudonocardia sp.]|nr:methyltransferase domain-containing protein [Pseudonocardia sp.]
MTRVELRDADLAEAAIGLLRHDSRFPDLDLAVHADGRVLHLTGAVDTPAELAQARELLGRLAGVLAVWDRVRVAGTAPVTLDLGCGNTPQYPHNIGIDQRRADPVAALADLRTPLPIRDTSIDRIFAVHILEHLPDYLPLIDECHRTLRPGGILHILTPWWRHVNAVADPTHLRLFDTQTIKGICARAGSDRCWYPLHVARDEATVFADLTPLPLGAPPPQPQRMARFFD